jgi:hypothetical protein
MSLVHVCFELFQYSPVLPGKSLAFTFAFLPALCKPVQPLTDILGHLGSHLRRSRKAVTGCWCSIVADRVDRQDRLARLICGIEMRSDQ